MFQFLMVRLKATRGGQLGSPCWFQFLMVRLKEIGEMYSEKLKGVSIPYGTIKRGFRCIVYAITHVSIPYGTIKRFTRFLKSVRH